MPEESTRDFLEIRALTDPGLREAIGGVCVHWALLELTIERVLSHLAGDGGVLRYESDLGNNLQRLLSMAEDSQTLDEAQKSEIADLVGKIRSLRNERHRITHGLWGKDDIGAIHSIFPALKRNVEPVVPITIEDIRTVKLATFFLGKALRKYVDPSDQILIRWDKE
jgi:hypothetical protein